MLIIFTGVFSYISIKTRDIKFIIREYLVNGWKKEKPEDLGLNDNHFSVIYKR
ncbi:hypothetical protein PECL_352 [Pediococcus claussenii ATCC BAA-344]|uniref:Uncharacterized protein n=1 Tax=Pediococcus claussenii (strain ATCC BAA-344 / DSM 14800 / JCM 18046 / KCTC 3811 / LMG 21948 / P06) TaxID=701521 RepID=G8PB34_PEDCP|nr:hypothetical protein PECL_352 [Pediococcus claussenii ATCC BAA-344]KRN20842.1 hypothetical protein IV79_GL000063 [Pediococcus claussenii]